MFETDQKIIEIKNFHAKLRTLVNIFFIIVICIVCIYVMYYNIINNDYWGDFNYTKQYFRPYAEFVTKIFTNIIPADNLPGWFTSDPNRNHIYTSASLATFILALPSLVLYFIVDFIKDIFIKLRVAEQNRKKNKLKKIEAQNELLQYEVIKYISICVSFDWEAAGSVAENAKTKLNLGIYQKLQKALSKSLIKNDTWIGNSFVIRLNDFNNFDNLFGALISILAKIKQQLEKSNDIRMIPTISVDAYVEEEDFKKIENYHLKVKNFGFTNKACSNNLFVKKYRYLNLKKYLGYSTGDYADFNAQGMDRVELNVIYDDLNSVLKEQA